MYMCVCCSYRIHSLFCFFCSRTLRAVFGTLTHRRTPSESSPLLMLSTVNNAWKKSVRTKWIWNTCSTFSNIRSLLLLSLPLLVLFHCYSNDVLRRRRWRWRRWQRWWRQQIDVNRAQFQFCFWKDVISMWTLHNIPYIFSSKSTLHQKALCLLISYACTLHTQCVCVLHTNPFFMWHVAQDKNL